MDVTYQLSAELGLLTAGISEEGITGVPWSWVREVTGWKRIVNLHPDLEQKASDI